MSPSFPSEGKTVLVWVEVLPFLCLLQIFHSPWELSMDHTLLKNSGSFWSGRLLDFRQTQELHSKQRWTEQGLPWLPNTLREHRRLPGTAQGHLCSQQSSLSLLPSRGKSLLQISLHLPFLLPDTLPYPPAMSCSSQDNSWPTGIPSSRSLLLRMILHVSSS